MKTSGHQCYFCGQAATSREHVPPLCIFPEAKDSFGKDHRKNLITVPSCDEHNLKKSKDDEFLMACVTATVGNNGAAYIQTNTKLRRAFERNEKRLFKTAIAEPKDAIWKSPAGKEFPILVGQPDLPRLCRVLDHVARGLYFHVNQNPFRGKCRLLVDWVKYPDDSGLELVKRMIRIMFRQERHRYTVYEQNSDIFKFGIGPTDAYGLTPMLMTFFRGSHVWCGFQPEGVEAPFRTLDEATPENPIIIDIKIKDPQ
jgi:hypothetical protein